MSWDREGSFEDLDFPRWVAQACWVGATGTFRAVRSDQVKEVLFDGGLVADATSSEEEDQTTAILLGHGKLTREQLALARQASERGGSLKERLVRLGFVTEEELRWAGRKQAEQVLGSLIGWRQGTYRFFAGRPPEGGAELSLLSAQLLLDIFLRDGDPDDALQELGGFDAVLRWDDAALLRYAVLAAEEPYDLLLTRLDGRRPLGEVLGQVPLPAEDAVRFLHALQVLGLVWGAEGRPMLTTARPSPPAEGEEADGEAVPPSPREVLAPEAAAGPVPPPVPEPPKPPVRPVPARDRFPAPRPVESPEETGEEAAPPVEERGAAEREREPPAAPGESAPRERRERPPSAPPVLTPGTVFEVVFAVFLLGGLFAGVLYMGRHLSEFREELVDVTLPAPTPVDPSRPASRAFRPGSAERVVAEARYRLLDQEPIFPRSADPAWLQALEESPEYREGLQEFRSGNYGRAAEVWASLLSTRGEGSATVHAGTACDPEALRNTADFVGPGFLMVRSAEREECFECLWGLFAGRPEAREAMGGTPLPSDAHVILASEAR